MALGRFYVHTPSIIIIYYCYFPFGRGKEKNVSVSTGRIYIGEYIGKRFVTHNRVSKVGQNDRDSHNNNIMINYTCEITVFAKYSRIKHERIGL